MPGTLLGTGHIDIDNADIFPILRILHASGAHDSEEERDTHGALLGKEKGERSPIGGCRKPYHQNPHF